MYHLPKLISQLGIWSVSFFFPFISIRHYQLCLTKQASKSIPGGAQYVTLQKYFSHPSLVIYFFATPPLQLKLKLQIGRRLLIANQLDESL
jgi:hypothetical protein